MLVHVTGKKFPSAAENRNFPQSGFRREIDSPCFHNPANITSFVGNAPPHPMVPDRLNGIEINYFLLTRLDR
jgi:hypothetical protein